MYTDSENRKSARAAWGIDVFIPGACCPVMPIAVSLCPAEQCMQLDSRPSELSRRGSGVFFEYSAKVIAVGISAGGGNFFDRHGR